MPEMKIKLLNDKAKVPSRAYTTDAGADIYATGMSVDVLNNQITYHTGIALEIHAGYYVMLVPRSSISNTGLRLTNSVGIIDSDYRGEILFKFDILKDHGNRYNIGDKIGQMILCDKINYDFKVVNELSNTQRGVGGFGSTGK